MHRMTWAELLQRLTRRRASFSTFGGTPLLFCLLLPRACLVTAFLQPRRGSTEYDDMFYREECIGQTSSTRLHPRFHLLHLL
jgi:hypothetical protein